MSDEFGEVVRCDCRQILFKRMEDDPDEIVIQVRCRQCRHTTECRFNVRTGEMYRACRAPAIGQES